MNNTTALSFWWVPFKWWKEIKQTLRLSFFFFSFLCPHRKRGNTWMTRLLQTCRIMMSALKMKNPKIVCEPFRMGAGCSRVLSREFLEAPCFRLAAFPVLVFSHRLKTENASFSPFSNWSSSWTLYPYSCLIVFIRGVCVERRWIPFFVLCHWYFQSENDPSARHCTSLWIYHWL